MLEAHCRYVDNRDLGEERVHENTNYRILYLVLHSQTIVDPRYFSNSPFVGSAGPFSIGRGGGRNLATSW